MTAEIAAAIAIRVLDREALLSRREKKKASDAVKQEAA
jgi:hypothetical protein